MICQRVERHHEGRTGGRLDERLPGGPCDSIGVDGRRHLDASWHAGVTVEPEGRDVGDVERSPGEAGAQGGEQLADLPDRGRHLPGRVAVEVGGGDGTGIAAERIDRHDHLERRPAGRVERLPSPHRTRIGTDPPGHLAVDADLARGGPVGQLQRHGLRRGVAERAGGLAGGSSRRSELDQRDVRLQRVHQHLALRHHAGPVVRGGRYDPTLPVHAREPDGDAQGEHDHTGQGGADPPTAPPPGPLIGLPTRVVDEIGRLRPDGYGGGDRGHHRRRQLVVVGRAGRLGDRRPAEGPAHQERGVLEAGAGRAPPQVLLHHEAHRRAVEPLGDERADFGAAHGGGADRAHRCSTSAPAYQRATPSRARCTRLLTVPSGTPTSCPTSA